MINEVIITKLGLVDVGMHNGQSFIHNCQILHWPIRKSFKVYVMDCDMEGNPLEKNMLNIYWNKRGEANLITITCEAIIDDELREFCTKSIPEENFWISRAAE